jgi:callose synthase
MTFLNVLSIYGATVGLSLGVLVPLLLPGVCWGASVALLIGTFFQHNKYIATEQYFPIAGTVLSILMAFLCSR